jgi:CheY-like chemotaxis protein
MTTVADAQREPKLLRVLVAEDNLVHQKLALALLSKRGHSVVIAANGKEAVELLEGEDFDVVLMDIEMPIMDGIKATSVIRKRESTHAKHTPVIAVSATADLHQCLAAGMDGWISKPLKADMIEAAVQAMLPVSEKRQARARE